VTREALVQLYVQDHLSVVETARTLGVSTEYLTKQLRAHRIAKRPGSFTPRSSIESTELVNRCVELYEDQQLTMGDIADQLGVSKTTVRNVLHESKVAVRPGGLPHVSAERRPRHLLSDLYGDEEVTAALVRHGVAVQDPASWRVPGPTETVAPLPLSRDLLVDLYIHVGLSIFHIGLVCGVGKTHVDARLKHFAIPRRSPQSLSPWMKRTYGR
jgi:transposase-like protein